MRGVGAAPRATPPTVDNQLASVARTPLQRCHAPPYFPRAPRCRSIQMLHALLAPACSSSVARPPSSRSATTRSTPTRTPPGARPQLAPHVVLSALGFGSIRLLAHALYGCTSMRRRAGRAAFVSPAATWSRNRRRRGSTPGGRLVLARDHGAPDPTCGVCGGSCQPTTRQSPREITGPIDSSTVTSGFGSTFTSQSSPSHSRCRMVR